MRGSVDDRRPPRAGRAGLPRPHRRRRRARPAGARRSGELTYRRVGRAGPGAGRRASTRLGVGQGERVAIVSQNAARLLVVVLRRQRPGAGSCVPINFRLHRRRGRATSSSTPAPSVLLVDPELDDALAGVDRASTASCSAPTTDAALLPRRRRARAVGARRGRHRHHQLHERHDRPAQGRAADPPQPLAQRHDVRLARRRERPRRVPAHAADVPLQRLGHAVRASPAWARSRSCCARSTAPRSCAASSATASRCCAAPRRSSPRSSTPPPTWDGPDPRRRAHPHGRGRRAAARPARSSGSRPSSAGSSSRSTGSPRRRRCSR